MLAPGLDHIIGIFTPANLASGRVMGKLGLRDWRTTTDPTWGIPLLVRRITRDEWSACIEP
jgi:RimJ/RimL family protein N-acetyltransferase